MLKEPENDSKLTQLKLSFNRYTFNTSSYANKMSNRSTQWDSAYSIYLIAQV